MFTIHIGYTIDDAMILGEWEKDLIEKGKMRIAYEAVEIDSSQLKTYLRTATKASEANDTMEVAAFLIGDAEKRKISGIEPFAWYKPWSNNLDLEVEIIRAIKLRENVVGTIHNHPPNNIGFSNKPTLGIPETSDDWYRMTGVAYRTRDNLNSIVVNVPWDMFEKSLDMYMNVYLIRRENPHYIYERVRLV